MRILLCTGHPDTRALLLEAARELRHEAVCAEDGARALDLFAAKPFPIVAADFEGAGSGLFERLRALPAGGETFAIALLPHGRLDAVREALRRGANDCIPIPCPPDLLRVRLAVAAELAARLSPAAEQEEPGGGVRMKQVFHSGPFGLFQWSLDGTLLDANEAFLRMLGYRREDLKNGALRWSMLTPPGIERLDERAREELRRTGVVLPSERDLVRKDGTRLPVLIGGALQEARADRGVSFVVDLSEQKRTETELRDSKDYVENLIRTANVMIVGLDADGRVQVFNEEAEKVTGYRREEFEGRNWLEVLVPRARYPEAWAAYPELEARQLPESFDSPILAKDGRERHIRWQNSLLRKGDRITGSISFGLDLTEQRGLEEHLRQAGKMEAIGRLAGGVAHDFNNLLMVISGYSELLMKRMAGNAENEAHLRHLMKAVRRAVELTRQLLAFGRKQVLQLRVIELNLVIGDLERILRRLIGEHIRFETRLDPRLRKVKADSSQVEQVIMNLVLNARDAMPKGGVLSIETGNIDVLTASGDLAPGPYVCITVSDTGVGMDAKTCARIFEPFFTTKEVGKGTGLGLAMVYGIVKQSGGVIQVDSEPGKGTRFHIYLPEARDPSAPTSSSHMPAIATGGTESILLVEDEDGVRNLLFEFLCTKGYQVIPAMDGQDALELARRTQGPIHLLVTDVVMPRMGGPELARVLKAERPELAVLFTSGYTGDQITSQGDLGPEAEFLQKPFSPEVLASKVRGMLDCNAATSAGG
ncbi:MAG: PAS domain S-box protein [Planctomycetota bacterium]|nr:PAS domain S-box protein [Planctomycetota bacterium]